jgi:hypothetical protein
MRINNAPKKIDRIIESSSLSEKNKVKKDFKDHRTTFLTLKLQTGSSSEMFILWHVDPLIGNDREVSKYTTAVVM